ncbi:hypothetical protein [Thermococcus sp. MAR1]|uniref:hypothetical protein n=1 Tax=Thermococcus sp. MAR1 TaxID=1638263 RepID=UPI0014393AB0|nr:hypothetical protein [Thermococcus sp. MAR1]NJE10075.1 hypothetical protein [Thermococcus sp. MAR1]
MGNRGNAGRKLFASVLLLVPSVVMFLENASLMEAQRAFNWLPGGVSEFFLRMEEWVVSHIEPALFSPTAYSVFAVVTFGVMITSFVLALLSGWSLKESGRNSLGNFVRLFLSRFFIGELALSLYGLFIFVLFAIILTAWLPDALEAGNPWFIGGTILYFLSIIFATAFAYPAQKPPEKGEGEDNLPRKARYLVYALSRPSPVWRKALSKADCYDMKRNREIEVNGRKVPVSLFPLYVSMAYHSSCDSLERLYLVVTPVHTKCKGKECNAFRVESDVKDILQQFFKKASECLGVSFRVEWPCEEAETIGNWERTVTVKFVNVGDPNDVKSIFQAIAKSEIRELIERESDNVTFHLTGGTAPVSIAMMLHAIKGDTHAEYIKQNIYDAEPEDLLMAVDMDIFDLEDLARELREYFERRYEKNLDNRVPLD